MRIPKSHPEIVYGKVCLRNSSMHLSSSLMLDLSSINQQVHETLDLP